MTDYWLKMLAKSDTIEVDVELWQEGEQWLCGVCNGESPLRGQRTYTALSSIKPNVLIHVFWKDQDLPDDETRDGLRDFIWDQVARALIQTETLPESAFVDPE